MPIVVIVNLNLKLTMARTQARPASLATASLATVSLRLLRVGRQYRRRAPPPRRRQPRHRRRRVPHLHSRSRQVLQGREEHRRHQHAHRLTAAHRARDTAALARVLGQGEVDQGQPPWSPRAPRAPRLAGSFLSMCPGASGFPSQTAVRIGSSRLFLIPSIAIREARCAERLPAGRAPTGAARHLLRPPQRHQGRARRAASAGEITVL